ncbi:MAG TPA: hypothetical protein VGG74_07105 [Kofleriaceae bacterium]
MLIAIDEHRVPDGHRFVHPASVKYVPLLRWISKIAVNTAAVGIDQVESLSRSASSDMNPSSDAIAT